MYGGAHHTVSHCSAVISSTGHAHTHHTYRDLIIIITAYDIHQKLWWLLLWLNWHLWKLVSMWTMENAAPFVNPAHFLIRRMHTWRYCGVFVIRAWHWHLVQPQKPFNIERVFWDLSLNFVRERNEQLQHSLPSDDDSHVYFTSISSSAARAQLSHPIPRLTIRSIRFNLVTGLSMR